MDLEKQLLVGRRLELRRHTLRILLSGKGPGKHDRPGDH
jgi:hypothetical protein